MHSGVLQATRTESYSPAPGSVNAEINTTTQPQRSPPPLPAPAPAPAAATAAAAAASQMRTGLGANAAHLTNLFYTEFHPMHPVLVPKSHYTLEHYPGFLRLVIQLIGSHYAPSIPTDSLRSAAGMALKAIDKPTVHSVQALLLYSIVLHARNELQEASNSLNKAIGYALDLGLHHAEAARSLGSNDPVQEESVRRTWWELYVTDGYLAALHSQTSFRCDMVQCTTLLPSENSSYSQGIIPFDQPSIKQFQERLFADEEMRFSSFCYRIEAVRIIGRLLAVSSTSQAHPDSVQAIDNAIASWKHHLPEDRAGVLDDVGEVDQAMFQAQVLIHFASILLHFPRSELPLTLPNAADIACSKELSSSSPTSNQHAVKAIAASKEISNLAALPVGQSSPFFICGLVFGCMVQLSACSAHAGNCFEQHKDRVALMTGVLKSLGRVWDIANCALARLRPVANEIFYPRKKPDDAPLTSSDDSGIDMNGLPQDLNDINWFDLFEGMQDQAFTNGEEVNF